MNKTVVIGEGRERIFIKLISFLEIHVQHISIKRKTSRIIASKNRLTALDLTLDFFSSLIFLSLSLQLSLSYIYTKQININGIVTKNVNCRSMIPSLVISSSLDLPVFLTSSLFNFR